MVIRGARTHNLQSVDLDIPRDRLVVLTGVSGSGKSSLAFDTIFAEGQRRYIECLSSYARQFLDQLERPDVDLIEGLPPTVAIDQKAGQASPRSTVGTITEIHDYLRLLFARLGTPDLPELRPGDPPPDARADGRPRDGLSPGRKVMLLAPLVRGRKGQHLEVFQAIRRAGLIRARVDGEIVEVTDEPPEARQDEGPPHRGRRRPAGDPRGHPAPAGREPDLALKLGEGWSWSRPRRAGGWEDHVLSIHLACPACGTGLQPLEPRTFSFNSPYGACPACEGLGVVATSEPDADEAAPCPACDGSRLRPEARAVRVGGQVDRRGLGPADRRRSRGSFEALTFDPAQEPVAPPLVREIAGRLRFLDQVGLGYLTLDRGSDTLSGGELQRARLATQLGAGLVGVCYVLDEPTAGLHPRDTDRLIASLRGLQDQGNSVLVVEHDEAMIRAADWLVDLGPGAGPDGGRIVATGRPEQLAASADSITGRYLRDQRRDRHAGRGGRLERSPGWIVDPRRDGPQPEGCRRQDPPRHPDLRHGRERVGQEHAGPRRPGQGIPRRRQPPGHEASGAAADRGARGDRQRWSRSIRPRSAAARGPRPATFTGVFDEIRKVFAATRQAKIRGYGAARFSFNAKGGRCEACEGQGRRRIPMHFLPDLYVTCEDCRGQRFNRQTLEVRFKGKSIGDVLEMRVDEAREFFDAQPRVLPGLDALHDVGLGYVTLGQSSTTLSGGEAQRIKLAAELGRRRRAAGPSTSSTSRRPASTSPTSTACSTSSTAWPTWATRSSSSSTTST